ncbi:hypothetical protein [Burkholderia ambifaria]|uniref:hypothetical protein n=1 Tax=Burkholderia ambifaria TaxID=152480 RepID=UPI001B95FB0A|nr:hypothetical protein [Burkholderia ambifaria]MBR8175880.1 hypothetical protein [Burkholderia ambifaria]
MRQLAAESAAASPVEPVGAAGTTATGIVRKIATSAYEIEPDRNAVFKWITQAPLAALGHKTALELVATGNGDYVLQLLQTFQSQREAGGLEVVTKYPFEETKVTKCGGSA